ncbi:MAG: TIM barrel protein, partial [Bryobacterales bacterium]|nr:TIM barrel protein [Bryobacterales bacterium]
VQGLPIPRQLELYAQNGFQQFEYNGLPSRSPEEVREIRKKMDELGMSMGVFVVNRGGWKPTAMGDKGGHKEFLEDVVRAVELHKVIRNECATVTSGLAVPHLTQTEQTHNAIEVLKRASDIASGTNLVLVLEPLNWKVDHAGYFVSYIEHAAEIIGSVDRPNVKILFDLYHQQITEGNLINHIRHYYEFIGYFQVGDVPGRKEPYTGEINFQNVFKAIYDLGFKGLIGMEHGLSVQGMPGLMKCFEAYKKADQFEV